MKKTGKKSTALPHSGKSAVEGLSKKPPEESKFDVAVDAEFKMVESASAIVAPPKSKGGKRPGAGRPRVAEKRVSITVTLRREHIQYLREWGQENVSRAITKLIDAHRAQRHMFGLTASSHGVDLGLDAAKKTW